MTRRTFLALPAGFVAVTKAIASDKWQIVIPPAAEPGEPMIISGTFYRADGKTPAAGVAVDLYQTDAAGLYTPAGNDNRNPRLKGRLVTDSQGRYEFRTIKPGNYPGGGVPAHVHLSTGGKELPEFQFDGDPYLRKQDHDRNASLGRFSAIVKLERGKDGSLRGTRDFRLEDLR